MPESETTDRGAPDALMIPKTFKAGADMASRLDSICSMAEPILGGDRAAGRTAYVRDQTPTMLFVTLAPRDTLLLPGSGAGGGPRYTWERRPDGVEYGYLTDAAKEAKSGGS